MLDSSKLPHDVGAQKDFCSFCVYPPAKEFITKDESKRVRFPVIWLCKSESSEKPVQMLRISTGCYTELEMVVSEKKEVKRYFMPDITGEKIDEETDSQLLTMPLENILFMIATSESEIATNAGWKSHSKETRDQVLKSKGYLTEVFTCKDKSVRERLERVLFDVIIDFPYGHFSQPKPIPGVFTKRASKFMHMHDALMDELEQKYSSETERRMRGLSKRRKIEADWMIRLPLISLVLIEIPGLATKYQEFLNAVDEEKEHLNVFLA